MNLRERLRAWRTHFGLSQGRVASLIGVSASAVGMWEQESEHATEPTHGNLAAFCEALGISLAQFWGPLPAPSARKRNRGAA